MAATQSEATLVGKGGQVVRMRRFHDEPDDGAALARWSEDAHPGQFRETFQRVIGQPRIVFEDRGAANAFDVIDRGGESDGAGDVRRAGFETMRRFLKRAFLQRHAHDHLAAAMPGRYCLKNFRAAVERTAPGRPTHFVSGEGEEIATDFLNVDRQMSRALGSIDQRHRADRARFVAKLGHGIDRA